MARYQLARNLVASQASTPVSVTTRLQPLSLLRTLTTVPVPTTSTRALPLVGAARRLTASATTVAVRPWVGRSADGVAGANGVAATVCGSDLPVTTTLTDRE